MSPDGGSLRSVLGSIICNASNDLPSWAPDWRQGEDGVGVLREPQLTFIKRFYVDSKGSYAGPSVTTDPVVIICSAKFD